MSFIILIILFVTGSLLDESTDYDKATDQNPNNILHKPKRWLHNLICNEEVVSYV